MIFLIGLFAKHAIVDLGLQSMLTGIKKHDYFSNAHIHYAQHGFFTLILALALFDPTVAVALAFVDYLLHWHVDFFKHHLMIKFGIKSQTTAWWWLNVVDQTAHYLTYFALYRLSIDFG